ncbi:MAG: SIR2 family protein [Cellulomonas sp.]
MSDDSELLVDRLTHRFSAPAQPIALVIGSAVSHQDGRGVANVRQIILTGLSHHPDLDKDQSLLRAVESSAIDLGDIYRQFMARLIKARGRVAADALIREAVLNAWRGASEPAGDGLDPADLSGWQLTDALVALAEVVASNPSAFPVIVTTNFDPLIEVALRRKGVETTRRVITADSSLTPPGGGVQVVYVHGFWHKAPTMHTAEQLMHSRPRLHAALVNTLKSNDVFVLGYGGWDDAITGALESLTMDDGASAEVLWAFYDSDPAVLQVRNRILLGRVGRLIIDGLFHQYSGIDCHQLLPEIARNLDQPAAAPLPLSLGKAPSGWVNVDAALLQGASALYSERDVRSFFDGRGPDWALASSSSVPEMTVVDRLVGAIKSGPADKPAWQFLLAPAGDGKSTALMQAGRVLANAGWHVISRPHPGVALDLEDFQELSASGPVVVLIDDADNCAQEIVALASQLPPGHQIHVIAAARLSDWRHTSVDLTAIQSVNPIEVSIDSLSRREARELIAAWASVSDGLGQLAEEPNEEKRLTRVLSAVAADRRSNGSLLGGLFRLRYDHAGLDAHVNALLDSLEQRAIPGSHVSLLRAFIYIAALEVAGLDGIDRRLWAELLGVDVRSLRRVVEYNLGAEAATARAGGVVQVRHPELATSAIRLLLSRDRGLDLAEVYSDIVRSAISLGKYLELRDYSRVVHLSTRLPEALNGINYSRGQAYRISLAAARSSVEAEPNLLVYQTDLASLLRKSGTPQAAVALSREAESRMRAFRDRGRAERGFYFDYALALSDAGDFSSAIRVHMLAWSLESTSNARVAGRHLVHLSKVFLRMTEEAGSKRALLALSGITRIAELIDLRGEDYEWCSRNARVGAAPDVSTLSADRCIEMIESSIAWASSGTEAEFGTYQTGDFRDLVRPML